MTNILPLENISNHKILSTIEMPTTILNYKLEYRIPNNSSKGNIHVNHRLLNKILQKIINLEQLCLKYNKLVYAISIDIYNKDKIEHIDQYNTDIKTFNNNIIIEYNYLQHILNNYNTKYDKDKNIKEIIENNIITSFINNIYINIKEQYKSILELLSLHKIELKYNGIFNNYIGINNIIIKDIEEIENKEYRVSVLKENNNILFLEMIGKGIDFDLLVFLAYM